MNSFRDDQLKSYALPMSMVWMLNDIADSKGKQELFTHQSTQLLKALREMALIQRAENGSKRVPMAGKNASSRKCVLVDKNPLVAVVWKQLLLFFRRKNTCFSPGTVMTGKEYHI